MASDEESDEDFVTYGTPLEPLEEDEPLRKPIPVHDQTVKDEKGRYKRFHGAFTGGFSAGYFNTVGTKEGWAPSTFVSSRNQKAEKHNARPEDFMDEEDFSEHGIAPQQITTTDDFVSGRPDQIKDKARAISSLTAPIPGDTLLEELIAPARSSIGVELLRKMGWKDGQGVGPRLKRRRGKQDSGVKVYGCVLPPKGSEESEDDDEFAPENVTFAPKDVTPVDFTPKDDVHGLGYRGLNPLQALSGGPGVSHINLFTLDSDRASLFGDRKAGQHRKGGISGQAFGVGAMEDEDDDIYHKDAMSNYDVVLGGEEPGDGLYGWTAPQQYRQKKRDSSRDAVYVGKILEGFTLTSKPAEAKTVFPPPVLPRDYRPVHYFRPVVDTSSVSPMVAQVLQASRGQLSQNAPQLQSRHTLDSAQRREMLGETGLQGPRSVFELLDSKDRERLSEIRKSVEEKRATLPDRFQSSTAPSDVLTQLQVSRAQADLQLQVSRAQADVQLQPRASDTAQRALSVWSSPTAQTGQTFRPFEKNPSKQARYDRYISHLKQGDRAEDAVELSLDPAMTEWERSRERDEFVRASVLYKPTNSSLSSRFTRAKHEDDTDSVEVPRDQEGDKDDKQAAVKMKMFGKLTRDTMEWHPDKLLCKRFNVPHPYPGSSIVGLPKVKRDKFSIFNFLSVTDDRQSSQATPTSSSGNAAASSLGSSSSAASGKRSRWDVADQGSKVKETPNVHETGRQQEHTIAAKTSTTSTASSGSIAAAEPEVSEADAEQKTQTAEDEEEAEEEEVRPPMDLFKAIFASSSDEKSSSSSEEDSGEEEEREAELQTPVVIPAQPVAPQAPPTSRLSSVTEPESRIADKGAQKDSPAASSVRAADLDREEFGPRLPPPGQAFPSSSSPVREEKAKKRSKERHKSKKERKHGKEKKHKKKSKKHKHKGKQKKKKKEEEETDSSADDSDSDGGDVTKTGSVSNKELLQRLKNLRGKK
ncbi:G patch domain-containing protein 1 isoform X2 [Ictalurus furcatus]|uniref:G patch domain-containing protein 1 isoform X2 n=1 Tax=Ictalurus furcatus TaxID=66913 RepID=UPI002350DE41|nr:G patch domain-containing protein 1 isoform X2 [Ictalurus furcatus]